MQPSFGSWLRYRRKNARLTITECARRAGIDEIEWVDHEKDSYNSSILSRVAAQDQVDAMLRAVEVPEELAEDVVYLMRFVIEHPQLDVDCTPKELEKLAAATIAAIHEEEAFPGSERYRDVPLLFVPAIDLNEDAPA